MIRGDKKSILALACTLFFGSIFAAEKEQSSTQPSLHIDNAYLNPQALIDACSSITTELTHLDYATSKECVLCRVADQELVLSWNFPGSGNIFDKMPSGLLTIRSNPTDLGAPCTMTADEKFYELGKVLVKNEMLKAVKKSDLVSWIHNREISPVSVFGIKLLLLAKNMQEKKSLDYFYQEFLCLLFRLSLIDHSLFPNGLLTTAMPELLKDMIDAVHPKLLPFCDEVLAIISNDKTSEQAIVDDINKQLTSYVTYEAFIFRSEKLSNLVLANCKDDFKTSIDDFINANRSVFHLISPEVFEKQRNSLSMKNTSADELKFAEHFVTSTSFSGNKQEACTLVGMPETVVTYLKQGDAKYPAVLTGVNAFGDHWVIKLDNRFGMLETVKYTTALLFKTLQQYSSMRSTTLKNASSQAQLIEEKRTKKIHDFLKTQAGRKSLERINEKTAAIKTQQEDGFLTVKKIEAKQQLVELNQRITEKQAVTKNLEMLAVMMGDHYQKATSPNKAEDTKYTDAIQKNNTELVELKKQRQALEHIINDNSAALATEQVITLKKTLADLKKIEVEQQADGETVSPELLEQIKVITQRIKTIEQQRETLEVRIALRELYAAMYEQEATLLDQERTAHIEEIRCQTDFEAQKIEYLRFSRMNDLYQVYIDELFNKAKVLHDDNKKVQELQHWRKAIEKVGRTTISDTDLKVIDHLEKEVGYIIDNNPINNSIISVIKQRHEVREFIENMTSNNDFTQLNQSMRDGLSLIIQHSDHIQDNVVFYGEAIKLFFPHFSPVFQSLLERTPNA